MRDLQAELKAAAKDVRRENRAQAREHRSATRSGRDKHRAEVDTAIETFRAELRAVVRGSPLTAEGVAELRAVLSRALDDVRRLADGPSTGADRRDRSDAVGQSASSSGIGPRCSSSHAGTPSTNGSRVGASAGHSSVARR